MNYRIYDEVCELSAQHELDLTTLHDPFFSRRDPFENVHPDAFPRRWCIAGGGIAGLTAAYEIDCYAKEHNLVDSVTIDLFERADRLGGRIHTHNFSGSSFSELGPMRIPQGHEVALHYVEKLNLTPRLGRFVGEANYFYRDRLRSGWDDILADLAANAHRNAPHIAGLMDAFAAKRVDPETFLLGVIDDLPQSSVQAHLFAARYGMRENKPQRLLDLYRARPRSAWGMGVDSISVREGFDLATNIWARSHRPTPAAERDFAQYLWDHAATLQGLNWLEHISALHFMREATALTAPYKHQLLDGFDSMVRAFTATLGESPSVRLHTGARVLAIQCTGNAVTVRLAASPQRLFRSIGRVVGLGRRLPELGEYDRVICALPTAAVRQLEFEPGLEGAQRMALNGVSYLSASKSAVLFKERWWELGKHGFPPKAGGVTFTDLLNQQIYYPNDNLREGTEPELSAAAIPPSLDSGNAGTSLYKRYEQGGDQGGPEFGFGPRDLDKSRAEGALIAAYMWGQNADRFASLSDRDRDNEIVACLKTIAPGCEKSIRKIVHKPWSLESNPGGGAFAWYEPAQHTRYQSVAGQPLCRVGARGPYRITFAGEHLGLVQGWLQGAMQSALAALRDSTR